MTLAVGLMTCGREGYTARTMASWTLHNSGLNAALYHADDASEARANDGLAQRAGFETIWSGKHRMGQMAMLEKLVRHAAARGATQFMLLENDWEAVRPLPEELKLPANIDCIRLYGLWKDKAHTRASGTRVMGTEHPIRWEAIKPGWERALAHWGGPPSVARLDRLLEVMEKATNFKAMSLQSTHWRTLRCLNNFFWHIGDETTPDYKA